MRDPKTAGEEKRIANYCSKSSFAKKGYSRIFFKSCSRYFNIASSILELELPFSSG